MSKRKYYVKRAEEYEERARKMPIGLKARRVLLALAKEMRDKASAK